MELVHKVFPLASSLLCLIAVVVSLFNLIDKAEGASSSSPSRLLESQLSTTRLPASASATTAAPVAHAYPINASIRHPPSQSPSSGRDEETGRLLFVAPGLMKKKKRLAALRKNATAAAAAAKTTTDGPSSHHVIFSERMEEYAFDSNGTEIVDTRNKTSTNNNSHKDGVQTTTADYLCPDKNSRKQCKQENLQQRSGTNAQQSTVPALEFILAAAVHVIIFVIFLYFWKTVYYPVVDPYATVSPYGFDVVTPPSNKRGMVDYLDSIMHTLEKSVTDER